VVLTTGVEYYPRLIEAARLYKDGFTDKVVINGNRKTDVLRKLEAEGFRPYCQWDFEWLAERRRETNQVGTG